MKIKNKKRKASFAFYVSGSASRLLKLLEKHSVVIENTALVVNDNAPNIQLNKLLSPEDIQYVGINYTDLGLVGDEKNIYISKLLLEKFKKHNIDYCFCFGCRILKGELLDTYKNKIINFHPSILPSFPGMKSVDQALNNNSFLLGNTAHFIDKGVDTGPVIMQSIIHSKNYSTYESVFSLQIPMIEQIYYWIMDEKLSIVDNKVLIKDADYTSTIFYPRL